MVEPRALPEGWQWVRLGDVCELNPRRPNLERSPEAPTSFVQMSSVDDISGTITTVETKTYKEVSKGYTYFANGDVLFAKITPCMQNGKHAIASNLIGGFGFGSTEFHVIRPKGEITADWIHRFVRQPWVLQGAIAHFTGAVGQQRVPASYLSGLQIPLPPLAEQKRIAKILNEQMEAIERARAATEAQLGAAKALPAAYLREVFDGPEAKTWPKVRLGEVCEINPRRPDLKRSPETSTTFVQMSAVDDRTGAIIRPEIKNYQEVRKGYTFFAEGDIIFAKITPCMQNGKHAIARNLIDGIGFGSTEFHVIHPKVEINAEWIHNFVRQPWVLQEAMAHFTGAVGQQRVPASYLSELEIPLPPLSEQKRIASILNERMESVEHIKTALEVRLEITNKLPAALLRRAFNGEL